MAKLIKVIRDTPECTDGPTTAEVPEEALAEAEFNGWRKAELKPSVETKPADKEKTKTPAAKEDKKVK